MALAAAPITTRNTNMAAEIRRLQDEERGKNHSP